MARVARITIPGLPRHVTQRGDRREPVFHADGDYAIYRDLLAAGCAPNPRELFDMSLDEASALFDIETKSMIGRPMGGEDFVGRLERETGRSLRRRRPGRKARAEEA